MIALHARRSFPAIEKFRNMYSKNTLIVILTGTDLYKDIQIDNNAKKSLELCDRLVVLQKMGVMELPEKFREKTRVIYQSAIKPSCVINNNHKNSFDVCVISNLRAVKDPFCTALASRELPSSSKIKVLHLGSGLDKELAECANSEMESNPRYNWVGKQSSNETRKILANSRLLVLSSKMEGGANVISEAIVSGIPVLASKISGTIGMLGEDYPGYFPVGDTKKLAELLLKAENETGFLNELKKRVKSLAPLFEPDVEKSSIKQLLNEFNL